jgi:hypothetical protein
MGASLAAWSQRHLGAIISDDRDILSASAWTPSPSLILDEARLGAQEGADT